MLSISLHTPLSNSSLSNSIIAEDPPKYKGQPCWQSCHQSCWPPGPTISSLQEKTTAPGLAQGGCRSLSMMMLVMFLVLHLGLFLVLLELLNHPAQTILLQYLLLIENRVVLLRYLQVFFSNLLL